MKEKLEHIGYKYTSLGWIPEDWDLLEFSDIAQRENGKFDPIKSTENRKCIELEHLSQATGEVLGYAKSNDQLSLKNVFSAGNILFGKLRPYLKKYWYAKFDGVCSSEIWVLNAKKNVCENEYLYNMVQTNRFIQVANVSSGSKMPRADWDYVSSFPFPLPTKKERQNIAAILATWDKAIEKTNQLITQKEVSKKWLEQQLLTGKIRLNGFNGDWILKPISSFAKEVSIKNKGDKDLTVLSCTKYAGLVPSLEYFGRKIFANNLTTYKIVPQDHFAYATNHIEEGSIGYQSKLNEALISPMYTVFKTQNVNDDYLYKVLKSYIYIHEYQKRMEGSIDRRGGLRWDEFSKIKVPVPAFEEQTAISNFLQTADKEIQILRARLEMLKEQKKGLMQVLLTGKVRVKIK